MTTALTALTDSTLALDPAAALFGQPALSSQPSEVSPQQPDSACLCSQVQLGVYIGRPASEQLTPDDVYGVKAVRASAKKGTTPVKAKAKLSRERLKEALLSRGLETSGSDATKRERLAVVRCSHSNCS